MRSNPRPARTPSAAAAARRPGPVARAARHSVEAMESRILFHFTVTPLPDLNVSTGTATSTVNLAGTVDSEEITGSVVRMTTNSGNIDVALYDAQKPQTVANFLNYVTGGDYVNTFFHRSSNLGGAGVEPVQIIQGGGYALPFATTAPFNRIPTDAPVPLEVQTNGVLPNARGTIAMARTSDPNSATSEFFINTTDNTNTLGPNNGGGYTVFGEVVNNTITTVDAIAALPRVNGGSTTPFGTLPVRDTAAGPTTENLVVITGTSVVPETTYTATSSNPGFVTASVVNNQLTLTYANPGAQGTADVTVTGTGIDGTVLTDTFSVAVGALAVTIGEGAARQVTFTDADGTVGTVSLKGGTATLAFDGTGLTQATDARGVTVTGAVANVSSLTLNGTNSASSLTVRARGGDGVLEVGDITAAGGVRSLAGRQLSVNGDVNLGSAGRVDLADLTGGSVTIGGTTPVTLSIPGGADDSDITSAAPLRNVTLGRFAGADGTAQTLQAPSISRLTVNSDFAGNLNVAGAVNSARVGGTATAGTWTVGQLGSVTIGGDLASDVNVGSLRSLRAGSVTGADVVSTTTLGRITTGNVGGSRFFANIPDRALPTTIGELGAGGSIQGVTVRGTFADSAIAAETVGRLNLGTVTTSNNGTAFGVAGDTIAGVSGRDAAGATVRFTRLSEPAQSYDNGDFEIRVL